MIYVTIWAILATIGFGITRYRNVLLARSATEENRNDSRTIESLHQIEIRQTLELLQLRDTNEAQADTIMRLRTLMGCQDHENDLAWTIVQDLTETLKDTTDTCLDLQFNRDTVAHELRSVCDKVHRMRGAIHGKDRQIAELKELVQIVLSDFAATNQIVEIQDRVILEHLTDREDLKAALAAVKPLALQGAKDAQTIQVISSALEDPQGFFNLMSDHAEICESPVLWQLFHGLQDFAALAANSVPVTPEIDEDEVHLDPIAGHGARKDFGLDLPF